MPNLDYSMIINLVFLGLIVLGFLFGFMRGFKKTAYSLVVMIIFYGLFFISINYVVNFLWSFPVPFLINPISGFVPDIAGATTIGEAAMAMVEKFLPDSMTLTMQNEVFISLVQGITEFVLKIVYLLVYFTVFNVIYRFFFFLVRVIFFTSKKDKDRSKKRIAGALFGAIKGGVRAFVLLIIVGGLFSMLDSAALVLTEDDTTTVGIDEYITLSTNYIPYNLMNDSKPILEVPASMQEYLDLSLELLDAYNNSLVVEYASKLVMTDENYIEEVPMHLYLFDSVISFDFEDDRVMFREELRLLSETAKIVIDSDYLDTRDLSDLTGEDIADIFSNISGSNFITNLVPLAVELGSDYFDVEVEIPVEELYAIDWASELQTLGAVASVGFDLVNTAGILTEGVDLNTVTLDGTEVRELFDSLSESELSQLAAYIALEPLLLSNNETLSLIITVPEGLDWEEEFTAFGEVAEAVLNTGLTVGEIKGGDISLILSSLSTVDMTVLLKSDIAANALKNIFSGDAGIEGLDMIIVPEDIVWFDTYDDEGNLLETGELREILQAVNLITDDTSDLDFSALDINLIADLSSDAIDETFESRILVATISDYVLNMDFGEDMTIIIPDNVIDEDGYITKNELTAVANAAKVLVNDLACDEDDIVCQEDGIGIDIDKAFSITEESVSTLVTSDIMSATLGQLIIDNGQDSLVIPTRSLVTITVDSLNRDVISKTEIESVFKAVKALGITSIDNMNVDPTIIQNLGLELDSTTLDPDKADDLFGSIIIQATLADLIFEQSVGAEAVLVVPHLSEDGATIIEYNAVDNLDYINTTELEAILQAILSLNITDFTQVDTLDLGNVLDNSATILQSSVLQATISKQVLDLGSDLVLVPTRDVDNNPVLINVGDVGLGTDTVYISKAEITNILDALSVLGIEDINNFNGDVDLATVASSQDNIDTLLTSATLHATISDQLLEQNDLGNINLPYYEDDNLTELRIIVDTTTFILKDEISSVITALNALSITDVNSFTGSVDLSKLFVGDTVNTVLDSSIIQATISDQLIDLDVDGTLELPYFEDDDTTPVRIIVGSGLEETTYVSREELIAIVDAMEVLNITTDINDFGGNVSITTLATGSNAQIVLSSATIQATVSKQVLDLINDPTMTATFVVPYYADDNLTRIRKSVGDELAGTNTEYVIASELDAMIHGINILGIDDVTTFGGSINLTSFYDELNRTTLLTSSILQATISQQLIELGSETLNVPSKDIDNIDVRFNTGIGLEENTYVSKDEISAIFEVLELLNITDVTTFDGTVTLTNFYGYSNQTILLNSAAVHATISDQMFDLTVDDTLIVPTQDITGTPIQTVVDTTTFITKNEIRSLIDVLELLAITDVNNFDGTVTLDNFYGSSNQDILLNSASVHATISDQMFDLTVDDTLVVPTQDITGTSIQTLVDTTTFITKNEIKSLIDVLELLGINDVNSFDGSVTLDNFYGDTNQNILLASASVHATISKQMFDLNTSETLIVPTQDIDGVSVQTLVDTTNFITKSEIKSLIDVLELLEINDVNGFTGTVTLTNFYGSANQEILLASASVHATISKQMFDLNTSETLIVPTQDILGIEVQTLVDTTIFITKPEIKSLIDVLELLSITDVNSFTGSVDLTQFYNNTVNQELLLGSASIHATISKQMLDLNTTETLIVPNQDVTGTNVQITVDLTTYVTKDEIKSVINVLDLLDITDINDFSGTVTLTNFYNETNQNILLTSASMHATISKQMFDLNTSNTLLIPQTDIVGTPVQTTVGIDDYVVKNEIKSLINALEILGINDVNGFSGTFDLTTLTTGTSQDTLLLSASLHATISDTLLSLDDAVLIVPMYTQAGELAGNEIRKTVSATEFIVKAEIKTLIDAFNTMEYGDLDSFGTSLDSSEFFTGRATLLLSSSIQATLSNKMLTGTSGELVVPDVNVNNAQDVRLVHTDVTYIELTEMEYILDALELLGLTDFTNMSFSPANVFLVDFNTLLLSASIQATISENILPNTLDETAAYGQTTLIVPTFFREAINVNSIASSQIEKIELIALLDALDALGVNDFGGGVDSSVISSMTDAQLDIMLASGSVHTTIDNMLRGNAYIASDIPTLAETDTAYKTGITTTSEIKAFIKATQVATTGGNFTSVQFDLTAIAGLDSTGRSDVADSMIVRNILTPDLETLASNPLDPYTLTNADYENSDPATFLIKTSLLAVVEHYYPAGS